MTKKLFTQEELSMLDKVKRVVTDGIIAEVNMNADGSFTVWAKEETDVLTDIKKLEESA